jgi:hypothetical protein
VHVFAHKFTSPPIGRFAVVVLAFLILAFTPSAFGQDEDDTDITQTAPPPLRKLTKDERTQLDTEIDVKRRTKLALELMSARLQRAETFAGNSEFEALYAELGGFHGLMDDTLAFLEKSDKDKGKVLNNFKRLEIGLRGFAPRLEVIRRNLPLKYEYYIRVLLRYLREARTRSVEPLFDDNVVKQPKKTEP